MGVNRLEVVERFRIGSKYLCRCRCICGNEHIAYWGNVESGKTKSCGCLRSQESALLGKKRAIHGKKGTNVYRVWQQMKDRCLNTKHKQFDAYGGRGITVSTEWLDFQRFYSDMGDPPPGMQIDRMRNDLGYSAANCRWATRKEQANNRRSSRLIDIDGCVQSVRQWCDRFGFESKSQYSLVIGRLNRGWSPKDALEIT